MAPLSKPTRHPGSTPGLGTKKREACYRGSPQVIAQLVERKSQALEVVGSNPIDKQFQLHRLARLTLLFSV